MASMAAQNYQGAGVQHGKSHHAIVAAMSQQSMFHSLALKDVNGNPLNLVFPGSSCMPNKVEPHVSFLGAGNI